MHEISRIRLLLVITSLLPQFYRTYKTHDISSFSLLFSLSVLILSSIWLIRLLLRDKKDTYIICEACVIILFYGFITVHILLQRTGRLKEGVAKDEDNLLSKEFLGEIFGETLFSGLESLL
jgi:hypothetical protein